MFPNVSFLLQKNKENKSLLTIEQKQAFKRDGYIILKECIPSKNVERALKIINVKLGQAIVTGQSIGEFGAETQCSHKDIVQLLYETGIWEYVEELVGRNKTGRPRCVFFISQ